MAGKELRFQQPFNVGKCLRHRGLRQADRVGGPLHTSKFRDLQQHLDVAKLASRQQSVEERRGRQVQGIEDSNTRAAEFIGGTGRRWLPSWSRV